MRAWRPIFALALFLSALCLSAAQTTVPAWLPFPIPPSLYAKWRKYGPWDYKAQGAEYRDFTQFNFGATGSAAGLDKEQLLKLAAAAKPRPQDIDQLVDPPLSFTRQQEALEKVRVMVTEDSHLTRIASDFTWLDSSSKWPREEVGLTEYRWGEYRALFERAATPEGIVRTKDFPGAIFFIARSKGLCTGGSSAGYVYSKNELSPIVVSPKEALDTEARKNPSNHQAYVFKRTTAPDWYTFYEVDW
jgi:hypothetical protein